MRSAFIVEGACTLRILEIEEQLCNFDKFSGENVIFINFSRSWVLQSLFHLYSLCIRLLNSLPPPSLSSLPCGSQAGLNFLDRFNSGWALPPIIDQHPANNHESWVVSRFTDPIVFKQFPFPTIFFLVVSVFRVPLFDWCLFVIITMNYCPI